jgi:hypothetical protein
MSLPGSTDRRVAAVAAFAFPSSVRQRVALARPDLTPEQTAAVEAAMRQWFRLAARRPKAKLAMPSVVVAELHRELALTREYAEFCRDAFGRPPVVEPGALAETLRLARRDEEADLPLLFRIDRELTIDGGKRYLADCGGRGQCFPLPGAVCLFHLRGEGKGVRGHHDLSQVQRDEDNLPRGVYGYP